MGETQQAWNEVGERFASWGRHVADRYKETGATTKEAGKETQRKLEDAARDVTDILDRAFTALGDTIRDEQAKSDLKDAVRALGDAVSVTVNETSEQIRKRVGGSPAKQDDATKPGTQPPEEPKGPSST